MSPAGDVKISGQFVLAYIEGVGQLSATFEEQAMGILEDSGIKNPEPEELYSADAFASALDETVGSVGPVTVRKIGASVAKAVEWPPEIDSVEGAFAALNGMHQEAHVNADEDEYGSYTYEQTGNQEARVAVTENYPYPDSFASGVVEGILDEFSPATAITDVVEADASGTDDKAVFEISW